MNLREFFILTTWWGKLLGAFFGYLTAGPAGAVFGLLVGNFFDRGLSKHFSNPHWLFLNEKQAKIQKLFFDATFSVMGYIAKADGRVTEQELNMARVLMAEMRLSQEQKIQAMHLFNSGKSPAFNLKMILSNLRISCKYNHELLKLFMDIQYRAAQTDGLSAQKIKALDVVFTQLGFSPFHQQYRFYEDFGFGQSQEQSHKTQDSHSYSSYSKTNYSPTKTNLDQAYALLEVNSKTSQQDVKRAYRRLLSKNHPDKLIAKGLPQEMIKIANEKTQKIVKAYEVICASKGW